MVDKIARDAKTGRTDQAGRAMHCTQCSYANLAIVSLINRAHSTYIERNEALTTGAVTVMWYENVLKTCPTIANDLVDVMFFDGRIIYDMPARALNWSGFSHSIIGPIHGLAAWRYSDKHWGFENAN